MSGGGRLRRAVPWTKASVRGGGRLRWARAVRRPRAPRLSARVCSLAVDEADKMLSLGMAPQLERLKGLLTGKRWTALLSATWPAAAAAVADAWTAGAARVAVATATSASLSAGIGQTVHVCAEHKKPAKLARHLEAVKAVSAAARAKPRVLVFCNRVKTVRFVAGEVAAAGFKVDTLHGERPQGERDAALAAFRAGAAQVLVATDVGGRGLNVPSLSYVVNYDFPPTLDAYIHRVGRAGRLGARGHAFSFLTRPFAPLAGALVALLQAHGQAVDPNLVKLANAYAQVQAIAGGVEGGSDDAPGPSIASLVDDAAHATRVVKKRTAALGAGDLPGLYGKGGGGGGDRSAGDSAAAAAAAVKPTSSKKKKALPGRLRKKLAREGGRAEA